MDALAQPIPLPERAMPLAGKAQAAA